MDDQLQLVIREKPLHRAGRIHGIVPNRMLVAIRVEDDRSLPELALERIRIELRLLLPDIRIFSGALRLDHRKRFSVIAPQNVVNETFSTDRIVGHSGDRIFDVSLIRQRPAGLAQQNVDEEVSSLIFAVVVRVGNDCVLLLGQRNFCLKGGALGTQGFIRRQRLGKLLIFRRQLLSERLQLSHGASGRARLRPGN